MSAGRLLPPTPSSRWGPTDRWLPAASGVSAEDVDARAILRLAAHLRAAGAAALGVLDDRRLLAAFLGAVAALRDPASPERRAVDAALLGATGLSQRCLDASLDALFDGFEPAEVGAVLARARAAISRPRAVVAGARPPSLAPHLLVLAADVPGVVLQPLLVCLALRRPAILKSSSREPFFAPAFAAALARREPALGAALAAVAWRGGEAAIEAPLLEAVDRVVAYGGGAALADLRRRAGGKLIAFGPKASVALIGAAAAGAGARGELERVASGLARDIALFEQRGCLSLQAIYAEGDGAALEHALAGALQEAARRWPPPALDPRQAAAVRLAREEAAFLGCRVATTPLEQATVIVDPRALFLPTAGHRTVRIHPVAHLGAAVDILRPHGARLQGAALAGVAAPDELRGDLAAIGVSYLCAPGRLQSPPATWSNGGIDLVAELAQESAL